MAFNAGAIVGKMKMDDSQWNTPLGKATKGVGGLAVALGTVAVAAMAKATVSADKWQKSMSNANTLTDEATVNSQDMAKSLLKLNPSLGDTTNLTDAMYQSFSSGAKTMDEALKTTTDAAMFSKAALTDNSTAVDVLTTAQNAYGSEVVSTTQASDIFFTAIKQGKLTGEELAGTIGKSIPLFASLNVPLEELSAGMAAMTKQGVNSAESTTQLNAIMNSFLKPSAEMSAALEAQGYASGSALVEAEGLGGALEFLEDTTGGSKDELSKLLPSVEAVRGALALTGTGGEDFNAIMEEMETSTGATAEAFGKQEMTMDTLAASMDKVELVAGNIGKYFVDDIAVGATQAAEGMLQFVMSGTMAEIVGNLVAGVSAGFKLLKEYMSPIVDNVMPAFQEIVGNVAANLQELKGEQDSNIGGFDLLSGASQFAASGMKVMGKIVNANITSIINLVTIVKESAQVLGSLGGLLSGKTTFGDVKEASLEAFDAIKNFGSDLKDDYTDVFTTIGDEVVSFGDKVKTQSIEMESSVTTTFTNTKDHVLTNWDEMITGQVTSFTGLVETVELGTEDVVATTDEGNAQVEADTKGVIARMTSAWKAHFSSFSLTAKSAFDMTLQIGSEMMTGLTAITQMETQNQLDAITLAYYAEEDALNAKLEAGTISQEEYDLALEKLSDEKTAKENEVNRKAFEDNKKFQIAGVWMDAASSIASWWSSAGMLGPIAGPIFASAMTGAVGAMAVAQTGAINDQQYVPARQFGGMSSGPTLINEVGGEIVDLPDGSLVIPNDISRQIASNANEQNGGGDIYISFEGANFGQNDPEEIADIVSRELALKMRGVA